MRWRGTGIALLGLLLACTAEEPRAADVAPDPPAPEPPPAPTRRADAGPPSILFVTLDTTRADRLGAYGYQRGHTPHLDALAQEGVVFERAYAPAPLTLPSHASMLTGLEPPGHGLRDNAIRALAPEAVLLSELLQERGWRTGAFVAALVLSHWWGLDQGFEVYREPTFVGARETVVPERSAREVVHDTVRWLEGVDPAERFFAWVHFYDPHFPHTPPEPWRSRLDDAYDAEIAFADDQLGRLLREVEARGEGPEVLVVVTADHGESLGDHGEKSHGLFLHESAVRVPLIVSGPPVAASRGRRVSQRVSVTALAPTLLSLAGLDPSALPGVGVQSLFASDGTPEDAPERAVYLETLNPFYGMGWRAYRGVVAEDHKLIDGPATQLYDLAADPGESNDLAAQQPERVTRLRKVLAELGGDGASAPSSPRTADLDERELLATLGYVVGEERGDPFDPELPDARLHLGDYEKVQEAARLHGEAGLLANQEAPTAWQRKELESQVRALRERSRELLLEVEQDARFLRLAAVGLGTVEGALGNYQAAVPLLERAVREDPLGSMRHYHLALAYDAVGRSDEALQAVHRAIELSHPGVPEFWKWMARHYAAEERYGRSVWWLDELIRRIAEEGGDASDMRARRDAIAGAMRERGQTPTPPTRQTGE